MMKSKTIIYILALALLAAVSSHAEANKLEGTISLSGTIADVSGNEAKFNEYRDITDGLYSKIRITYDGDDYFFKFKASDIGYDTQKYKLDGGVWGQFKFYLKYNEIPHNFTYGARTFYSGAGSNNLTYTSHPPVTDPSQWSTFDYSIERKQYGGGLTLDILKPFYLDISVSREERTGIKPTGVAQNQTGASNLLELPEPVDYVTDTMKVEIGYAKNPLFASLSFFYSEFENDNKTLDFINPLSANTFSATRPDALTLPPDNNYYKIAFKGSYKLPLNSKFNVNLASSKTKSDLNLLNYYVMDIAGGVQNITLSDSVFNGEITSKNYAFVLTSNPVPFLNGKIFYKYYEKENKSDRITITDSNANSGIPFVNHIFDYKKNNFGAELTFKLPANFSLVPAYTYLKIDRQRGDLPETRDNVFSIDLKWKGLDYLVAKAGYERLERSADHQIFTSLFPADQATANIVENYVRRFDAAPKDQDKFKLSVDVYPTDELTLGLGYKHKKADYKETVLGLRDEKSDEFEIAADYAFGKLANLNGYVSYEKTKAYQFQRRFPAGGNPDPLSGLQDSANYNWDATQTNKTYNYGVGAKVHVIPKTLTLKLQYDYIRSDGNSDLTYYVAAALPAGGTNDNVDHSNWDDYRRTSLMAKAIYNVTKAVAVTAGYAYERYRYNDALLDGYQFFGSFAGAGANNRGYLTGAYKDQSYTANVVFLSVAYKF